jgi:hypothetical protein
MPLQASLRISEAQQLYDGLQDALLRPALQQFFRDQRVTYLNMLVHAVRQSNRDTLREAQLAGKVEAYETALDDLDRYAKEQLAAQ